MIRGLEKKLTHGQMKGLDILFIVGDVFDRGLPVNHRDVPHIVAWIRKLLARCAKLGIVVLVLEGTPSHDRLQSQLFVAINDSADEEHRCDLRYIKEVSIEYIEKYDINVLCIPDEKNTSDEVTLRQVQAMMQARALEKVDFAMMHGFFEFQVPFGHHCRFHDSATYLDMVRYLIFIGHDHNFQQHDRIFVQGSPDRQRHGMESNKGFIRAMVNRDGTYQAKFEVNEHAMVFKTLEVPEDVDLASSAVCAVCDELPRHSHLRIAAAKGHPILAALDSFRSKYPFIHFSDPKVIGEELDTTSVLEGKEEIEYVPFTIDSSNLKKIVFDRLNIELDDPDEQAYFEQLMDSVM